MRTRAVTAPVLARPIRAAAAFAALGAAVFVAFALSLGMGAVPVAPWRVVAALFAADGGPESVIVGMRLARALLAAAVGASLASSGAVLQGLFRNPLADPYVIGSSGGSALGAVIAIAFGLEAIGTGLSAIGIAAFVGGLAATLAVYLVAGASRVRSDAANLLLAGTALGSLFSAAVSIILALKDKDLNRAWFWLLGGFSGRGLGELAAVAPAMLVGFAAAMASARVLDVLSAGDEEAESLGLSPARARLAVGAFAALAVSASVAVAGMIGFVGLVSPHLARRFVGPAHARLVPASAVVGATLLLLSDAVARTAFSPVEMPVGAVTALIGAPFFLYWIAKRGLR